MQNKAKKNAYKAKKSQVDFVLIIIILILLSFGIVMILSASAPSALAETGDSYTYVTKQILFAGIGLVLMFFLANFDYRKFKKVYWLVYGGSIAALLLVLIPGLGIESGGARRWINLGFTQLQP